MTEASNSENLKMSGSAGYHGGIVSEVLRNQLQNVLIFKLILTLIYINKQVLSMIRIC